MAGLRTRLVRNERTELESVGLLSLEKSCPCHTVARVIFADGIGSANE